MAYIDAEELRKQLKDDSLNAIIGDTYIEDVEEREKKILPIINDAIEDACGEIDGYLTKRYPVPLANPTQVITKFAKDIAVYNLYSRIGIDESSEEKNFLTRYNSAIKFLTLVAEGKIDIGADTVKTSASTGFQMRSNNRLFSRDSMRGM